MKIGEEAYVHGYIDEIRNGVIIIRNKGGYFGTEPEEVFPSAQPERKKGKWIGYKADDKDWQRDDGSPIFMNCSECHEAVINNGSAHWNFCPNCGADMSMRGEQDGSNHTGN